MNKVIMLLVLSTGFRGYGQVIVKDRLSPSFEWSLHLIDAPYMVDAAKTEAVRANDGAAPFTGGLKPGHYGKFYRNLSMTQNTEMARNLHGSLYYGHNVLWNKLVKPVSTGKYILNRLVANVAALGTDYMAIKLPYGYAFQHEEFHRAVMTSRHIFSYDEVWNFGKGLDIAVTHVKDEDLVYLKKNFPADQVRLSATGVEGEYAWLQRMQEDNFFRQTGYPFAGISILGTLHAVNYVNLPFTKRFDAITDSILSYDRDNILARDFTGYDFSAWVYDLFTPGEPYEARGTWPGGIGIRRPVKASDLTPEMKEFLRETGNMQYINFLSPFLLGINRLRLRHDFYFNFALRSMPTSFGYYAGGDFFLDVKGKQVMLSPGLNKSRSLTLPSLGLRSNHHFGRVSPGFKAGINLAVWAQPEDQLFDARKASLGMLLEIKPCYALTKQLRLTTEFSFKTRGWVFGNPYLDSKWTVRAGLGWRAK